MSEEDIIKTLKNISKFAKNRYDEGLGDYLHIAIKRTDVNVIDEAIYLIERKQKEIERKNKLIEKNRIALEECLKESEYEEDDE